MRKTWTVALIQLVKGSPVAGQYSRNQKSFTVCRIGRPSIDQFSFPQAVLPFLALVFCFSSIEKVQSIHKKSAEIVMALVRNTP